MTTANTDTRNIGNMIYGALAGAWEIVKGTHHEPTFVDSFTDATISFYSNGGYYTLAKVEVEGSYPHGVPEKAIKEAFSALGTVFMRKDWNAESTYTLHFGGHNTRLPYVEFSGKWGTTVTEYRNEILCALYGEETTAFLYMLPKRNVDLLLEQMPTTVEVSDGSEPKRYVMSLTTLRFEDELSNQIPVCTCSVNVPQSGAYLHISKAFTNCRALLERDIVTKGLRDTRLLRLTLTEVTSNKTCVTGLLFVPRNHYSYIILN